jgi:hypothetical protein
LSHDHAIHYLPFTRGQGREAGGHSIALGAIAGHLLAVGQNPVDALSQRLGAHRLLQEVGCALSHRLHRRREGATPGQEDNWGAGPFPLQPVL